MKHWESVSFFVPGIPRPQGSMKPMRSASTGEVIAVPSQNLAPWRTSVGWYARQAMSGAPPSSAALSVEATFRLQAPKKRRPYPSVRPDADKLTRAILDAMTGIVFVDDCQVVDLVVCKRYAAEPGVQILVEEMPG